MTVGQAERQANRQAGRQASKQASRQIDEQRQGLRTEQQRQIATERRYLGLLLQDGIGTGRQTGRQTG